MKSIIAFIVFLTLAFSAQAFADDEAKPGEIIGTITDADGKPIENAKVDVWSWYPGNETLTNRKGRFKLAKLDVDGPVELKISKDGYSPWYNVTQPTAISDLSVTLSNKTFFEGFVKDPQGNPVPKALVRANCGEKVNPSVHITEVWLEATTDKDGHYKLFVWPDAWEFRVRVPKVGVARLPGNAIAEGETKNLDIQLDAGMTFKAVCVDSESGAPVADVELNVPREKGIAGKSDKDGNVAIDGAMPGNFEFYVKAPGYARWWSDQALKEWQRKHSSDGFQRNFDDLEFQISPDMQPVTIAMEKAVTIRGVIQDPDGNPVAGATAAPANGKGNSITGDTRFSVVSGADGTFTMHLPASHDAHYNVTAHDGKYGETRKWANGVLEPIQTKPGDEIKDVVLKLTQGATVKGRAVDASGQPVVNREVRASAADRLENRYYDPTTRTDKDGNFELKFIRPGEQCIQVAPFYFDAGQSPGGSSVTVTLAAGETKEGVELTAKEQR